MKFTYPLLKWLLIPCAFFVWLLSVYEVYAVPNSPWVRLLVSIPYLGQIVWFGAMWANNGLFNVYSYVYWGAVAFHFGVKEFEKRAVRSGLPAVDFSTQIYSNDILACMTGKQVFGAMLNNAIGNTLFYFVVLVIMLEATAIWRPIGWVLIVCASAFLCWNILHFLITGLIFQWAMLREGTTSDKLWCVPTIVVGLAEQLLGLIAVASWWLVMCGRGTTQ